MTSIFLRGIIFFVRFDAKANNPSQLLAMIVDTLVDVPEDQFLDPLTADNHQRFVASLDELIDVVGEDKTHPFVPLMK